MIELDPLYPYQLEGAIYLANHPHALIADEPGLGKTAQTIRACDIVGAERILVVCPAAARINWSREFTRFSPMDRDCAVLFTGTSTPSGTGVTVVSYDLLASSAKIKDTLKAVQWDALILDEAHYLKERSAKRTKVIYGHNKSSRGIAGNSKRVWRITGTPTLNNVSDVYTHLKSAGLYERGYWDFVFEFCSGFDTDYGYKITGTRNAEQLKALLAKFMIRRKKEDVMTQLPPITYQVVTVERNEVELDPWFYENYRSLGKAAFLSRLEDEDRTLKHTLATIRGTGKREVATDILGMLQSLSTSTSTLRRYIGMAKLNRCIEIVKEELDSGRLDKIVIFAVHQSVIELTRQKLAKYGAVTLYGGTPADKRQSNIDKFQNNPRARVFIGNIQAAGTAITLTAAHEVAFFESDWVPANNAQAAMRVHRIGQTQNVRCRIFTCAGSVDEDITRILAIKSRELSKVID